MADKRVFTEDEHQLLLTERVSQETATLNTRVTALEEEKAGWQSKFDVLEAEKAAAITERDSIKAEFEKFKADIEERNAIAARRDSRVAEVKAKADHLPDDYFTPERADRWAAMTPEMFETAVADLAATRPANGEAPKVETAAFTGGKAPAPVEEQGFIVSQFFAPVGADK